ALMLQSALYFSQHQLQNNQALSVVTIPGVTRLGLIAHLESHADLSKLSLRSIFTCRPIDLYIDCIECTACQFFTRNMDKRYTSKRLACKKRMNKKLAKLFK